MARWYARFDSGSDYGWDGELDFTGSVNGYFERLRVSNGSASGAQFRDGLITSRSALSADVYDDLDAANKDGTKGILFPGDLRALVGSSITWSTAYTSSFEGIKIPTTNTYGTSSTIINYSTRTTSSVASTNPIIGPADPLDPILVSEALYTAASNAVDATLTVIQNGASTAINPKVRSGNSGSRTFSSLWNDPKLNYFAWDDFTPGNVLLTTPTLMSVINSGLATGYCGGGISYCGTGTPIVGVEFKVFYAARVIPGTTAEPPDVVSYANDTNPDGFLDLEFNYRSSSFGGQTQLALSCTSSATLSPRETGTYPYYEKLVRIGLITTPGTLIDGEILITASYRDPRITNSRGPYSYRTLGINSATNCPATTGTGTTGTGFTGPPPV